MSNSVTMPPSERQTAEDVRRLQQQVRNLRNTTMGYKSVPRSLAPTTVVARPWNSLTYIVVKDVPTATNVITKVIDLLNYVGTVNGISASTVQVKVQNAQMWLSGTQLSTAAGVATPQGIAVFYDLNDAAADRSTQADTGAVGRPARFGYTWPISDSRDVLGTVESTRNIMQVTHSSGASLTVTKHIHFLWKVVD